MRNKLSSLLIVGGLLVLVGSVGSYEHESINLLQLLIQAIVSTGLMITGKAMN